MRCGLWSSNEFSPIIMIQIAGPWRSSLVFVIVRVSEKLFVLIRPKKKDSCVQVSEVKKIRVGRSKNIFILDSFFITNVQRFFRGEITPLSSSYNISGLVPVCWLLFQCF